MEFHSTLISQFASQNGFKRDLQLIFDFTLIPQLASQNLRFSLQRFKVQYVEKLAHHDMNIF